MLLLIFFSCSFFLFLYLLLMVNGMSPRNHHYHDEPADAGSQQHY